MPTYLFANNAKSTLASGITTIATTLFVQTGEGVKFPNPAAGEQFTLTLVDSLGNVEIVLCTARTNDTFTIARAQEGTIAFAFVAGDAVELRLTDDALVAVAQKDGNLQVGLDSDFWDGANKTISTSAPSGGADGDIWFQYEV